MRLGIIACEVFARELSAAILQSKSICSVRWIPQGLHDVPDQLRKRLQKEINKMQMQMQQDPGRSGLDAIVLAYGLCGGATADLQAGSLPLVIPRTEDCIGLLLGSCSRYETLFSQYKGIYWLSCGWCEHANLPEKEYYTIKYQEYAAQFGQDNASWLMEQENAWISRYTTCIYITPPLDQMPDYSARAEKIAGDCGWKLVCEQGSNRILESLLAGDWDERLFFVYPPGTKSRMPYGKATAVNTI